MNTAAQYAKALEALVRREPTKAGTYLKNLREALLRRGHEKLLPRIWSEYQKLEVHRKRMEQYTAVTPEIKRNDVLLQLYKKLVAAK